MEAYKYSQLEIARIIGEPRDPFKPYPYLIAATCELDTADPDEYVYYFDALAETDKVWTTVASGVTQTAVTPDTPTLVTWVDLATDEYYVKFTDLAGAKERTFARKTRTINRSLNVEENYRILQLLSGASSDRSHDVTLTSGTTTFQYDDLVEMLDLVKDYGDNFILVAGTNIDKDIILWDWNDNKYVSLKAALADLNVEIIRINQTITRDNSSTLILSKDDAYLVGCDTEMGKPLLFVRKRLDDLALLGGVISEAGDKPERLVFASPNPITVTGSARHLAVGIIGFEQIVAVCVNSYSVSKFSRT